MWRLNNDKEREFFMELGGQALLAMVKIFGEQAAVLRDMVA